MSAEEFAPPLESEEELPPAPAVYHTCPGCGFVHESSGNEVPNVIVQGTREPTIHEICDALRAGVIHFGLSIDNSLRDLIMAIDGQVAAARASDTPSTAGFSDCPVCVSLGVVFRTDSAEAFNAHMAAGLHGEQPVPETQPAPPTPPETPPAPPEQ